LASLHGRVEILGSIYTLINKKIDETGGVIGRSAVLFWPSLGSNLMVFLIFVFVAHGTADDIVSFSRWCATERSCYLCCTTDRYIAYIVLRSATEQKHVS